MDHDQSIRVINRQGEPSKLDTHNYLTLCMRNLDCNLSDYYIQISHDPETPNWQYLGEMDNRATEILLRLIDLLK